jgi:hypothetical protein
VPFNIVPFKTKYNFPDKSFHNHIRRIVSIGWLSSIVPVSAAHLTRAANDISTAITAILVREIREFAIDHNTVRVTLQPSKGRIHIMSAQCDKGLQGRRRTETDETPDHTYEAILQ